MENVTPVELVILGFDDIYSNGKSFWHSFQVLEQMLLRIWNFQIDALYSLLSHFVYLKACFAVISANWSLLVSLFRYMWMRIVNLKYLSDT